MDLHAETHLCPTAKAVAQTVQAQFGVRYTENGMTALLHHLGDLQKKPAVVRCKSRANAQHAFLATYEALKHSKAEDDPIYFVDAVHPRYEPVTDCGSIKRGETHPGRANTRRQHVNTNGTIDLKRLEPAVHFENTISTDSSSRCSSSLSGAISPPPGSALSATTPVIIGPRQPKST